MSRDIQEILRDALALSSEARAALADSLLDSLDATVDEDAEGAWLEETQRRAAELDDKTVAAVPWFDVRSRLRDVCG